MAFSSLSHIALVLVLLIIVMVICIKTGKLSIPASLAAGLTGLLVYAGAGYTGLGLLGVFFILGTLATSHRKDLKAKIHPDSVHPETRKAGQVFANGGMAALLAIPMIIDPAHATLYGMMMAASLASATADTLSSELGMVYGRNFYNILSFKKEPKGLDGVVSIEGTLIGAAGAFIIAAAYSLSTGFDKRFVIILLAGVIGNLADSVLGASLERKHYINNDVVNFLNTFFAAVIALLLYLL
ncbi:DUF92 domain-containing protein [Chitinophaga sp. MM2321]|uniref:DUF92 domain-containing protein n=1 Tax=Chitinophaga sp. MM2321 TaxID=3137178 RepID=UPI0032D592DA